MSSENKGKYIKFRISETLKRDFLKRLEEDGINQSKFFSACIMNYMEIKTVPADIKKKLGVIKDKNLKQK